MKRRTKNRLKNLGIDLAAFVLAPFYWLYMNKEIFLKLIGGLCMFIFACSVKYYQGFEVSAICFMIGGFCFYLLHGYALIKLREEINELKKLIQKQ